MDTDNSTNEAQRPAMVTSITDIYRSPQAIGRILIGFSFTILAYSHYVYAGYFATFVPSFIPAPLVMVYVSGIVFFALGGALIVNKYTHIAARILVVLFTCITALVFGKELSTAIEFLYLYIATIGGLLLLTPKR
jgi:hypothetical protein